MAIGSAGIGTATLSPLVGIGSAGISQQPVATGPTAREFAEIRYLNRMQPQDVSDTTPPLYRTLDFQFQTLSAYNAVKFLYCNYSTSVAYDIQKANVFGAANYAVEIPAVTPTPVLFSSSATATVPLASSVTATGAPDPGPYIVPNIILSDTAAVNSIARDDAGLATIIRARTSMSNNSNICSVPTTDFNAATYNSGFYGARSLQNINPTNLATYDAALTEAGGSLTPDAVLVQHTNGPHYSFNLYGDSLSQSTGSPGTTAGWPQRLLFLALTEGVKVTTANYTAIGYPHQISYAMFNVRIAAGNLPSMMGMFGHSINSGTTQAKFDESWVRVQEAYATCLANGVTFVACWNPPSAGTSDTLIQEQNARLATLTEAIQLDFYSALQLGGVLNPLYDNGDGVHINPAGQLVMANVAKTAFQAIGIW